VIRISVRLGCVVLLNGCAEVFIMGVRARWRRRWKGKGEGGMWVLRKPGELLWMEAVVGFLFWQ
jgi:hypothetical protein